MTIYRLWIAALFLVAASAAQSLEVVANNDRISGRVFAPAAGPMSLGMQYGYDFSRDGKHDLAAIAKLDVLKIKRFTLSPEGGFGITRAAQLDTHTWTELRLFEICANGQPDLSLCPPIPLIINRLVITRNIQLAESTTRAPWLGTGIVGVSARYRLNDHLSLTGHSQRHWINNAPARNVWSVGVGWKF